MGVSQRSDDGGVSWFSARPVAVPPALANTDEPAFIASALSFAPDGSVYLQLDDRLWRSPDFGDTWTALPAMPARRLAVDPVAADVLWVTGPEGVFRSENGGQTWRRTRSGASDVIPSAVDPDVAWAIDRRTIRITTDGGATWHGLPNAPDVVVPSSFFPPVTVALPGRARSICVNDIGTLWCSDGGAFIVDAARTSGSPGFVSALAPTRAASDGRRTVRAARLADADGARSWHLLAAPLDDYTGVVTTRAGTFLAGPHGIQFAPRGSDRWRGCGDRPARPASPPIRCAAPSTPAPRPASGGSTGAPSACCGHGGCIAAAPRTSRSAGTGAPSSSARPSSPSVRMAARRSTARSRPSGSELWRPRRSALR